MRVGIITTIDTNIGDDFIRTGILNIVNSLTHSGKIEFVCVNKHVPYTIYPSWHPMYYIPVLSKIRGGKRLSKIVKHLFAGLGGSKFDNCDLIIQSGAPVLWPNCHKCEWNIPIWQEIIGRLYIKTPVLNIAAGSCYPWETKHKGFQSLHEADYARMIGTFCRLTTTRDHLASELFSSVSVSNIKMPCTAFFVDSNLNPDKQKKKYVLINYMSGGGHFDWGQHIDGANWKSTIKKVIDKLKSNHEVRFICHSTNEVDLAKDLDPSLTIHFPKTVDEYLTCIRSAKLGINNRMHASVAMASVGVESISVCTDTRLLMVENLGLPVLYVKDAEPDRLSELAESIIKNQSVGEARLLELKRKSYAEYQELFRRYLA